MPRVRYAEQNSAELNGGCEGQVCIASRDQKDHKGYVVEARLALEKICSDYAMPEYLRKASHFAVKCLSDSNRWNAKIFVDGVIEYWHRHGELPTDIRTFCEEFFRKADNESYGYRHFIESMFVVQKVSWKEVVGGAAYLKPKQGYYWNVDEVNSLLRKGLEESKATASGG